MRGYTVHLLFHLLAAALGAASGVSAGLWWAGHNRIGLWLAVAALVLGGVILIVQGLYISGDPPPRKPARARYERDAARSSSRNGHPATGTRPELEPVAAPKAREQPSGSTTRRS